MAGRVSWLLLLLSVMLLYMFWLLVARRPQCMAGRVCMILYLRFPWWREVERSSVVEA